MDNNLVKLTDEQLDEVTGAVNPAWLIPLIQILGSDAIKWWNEGGAAGTKKKCYETLGSDDYFCNAIPA